MNAAAYILMAVDKTKHKKFLILVPAFLFIHIALGAWLLFFRG